MRIFGMKNLKDIEFDNLILPTDEEVNRETKSQRIKLALTGKSLSQDRREKISASVKANPSRTTAVSEKIAETKRMRPPNAESRRLFGNARRGKHNTQQHIDAISNAQSKYVYTTPKGTFNSRKEMQNAYPDITIRDLKELAYKCAKGKDGFSRVLK